MREESFNSESSVPPRVSSEPASAESMLELRAKINDAMKKPLNKEGYGKLSAEIDTYQQNPYSGPELEEHTKKPGFISSLRRKLGI